MAKTYRVGDTEYRFPDEYSDDQVKQILSQQKVIDIGAKHDRSPRLKGKIDENSLQNQILNTATATMLAGPIMGAPGVGAGVAAASKAAGQAIKTGAAGLKGEAEGFSESMAGIPKLRGKVLNIGDALKRAKEIGKLRMQQANMPPRPDPSWKGITLQRTPTPDVNPIPATETPQGRAPGRVTSSPVRNPKWKGITLERSASPDVEPVRASETPQGRAPGKRTPPASRKPVWDKPSTPKEQQAKVEAPASDSPARTLAQSMHDAGLTATRARTSLLANHWRELFESMGLPKPDNAAISEVLSELDRLESRMPSPKGRLSPP